MTDSREMAKIKDTKDDDEFVIAVKEVRNASERHSMASDGGSSGRSDTNDSAAY